MTASALHSTPVDPACLREGPDLGEVGMGMLGLEPMPVQREIWALLEARGDPAEDPRPAHESTVVEVPRRAGKTEGLLALAVGRCATIPGYQVTYCAQNGTKSRERFYGLLRLLMAAGATGYRYRASRGEERFEFTNNSVLRFLPPIASNLRGDAIDWLILDEAQEVDEEESADLIGSALPTMDTRPDAQVTVAGTAGEVRSGLLWTSLEQGRTGLWGIVEYAAADDPDLDLDDEDLWLTVHPGPAGVSQERALEVLRKRHGQMDPEMFAREYLGVWPSATARAVFSQDDWQACLSAALLNQRPDRFGLAFDVTPSGDRAAVTATWRDTTDGRNLICSLVLDERSGSAWVAPFVADLATRLRVPVAFDPMGENLTVASALARLAPKVTQQPMKTTDLLGACPAVQAAVLTGTFRHAAQQPLDDAVTAAVKREIGDSGWLWGRRKSSGSIAPLVSLTVGLVAFDALPKQRNLRVLTART